MFARALNLARSASFLALALALAFSSCRSAQKFVENGDYDRAIDFCVDHLKGKKKKDSDLVMGLEAAFAKAQERDLTRIERLKASGSGESWVEINELYRKIEARQAKIDPLLPLIAKNGHEAEFAFLAAEKLELDSRKRASEHFYGRAESLLKKAETGDRLAAREAYRELGRIDRYFKDYLEKETLKKQARSLGTTHVLFEVENRSVSILPIGFERRLLEFGRRELDSEWLAFHFETAPGLDFDYRAVFKIDRIDVSPERISERSFDETATVQDGWEYVLDQKGQVKKDSAGRDIKQKRFIDVRARVIETVQTKAAQVTGYVEVFEAGKKELLERKNVGAEVVFEHRAATFVGDERALSDETRCRLGSRPLPFPTDSDMLVDAAERLKPNLRDELRRSRAIL